MLDNPFSIQDPDAVDSGLRRLDVERYLRLHFLSARPGCVCLIGERHCGLPAAVRRVLDDGSLNLRQSFRVIESDVEYDWVGGPDVTAFYRHLLASLGEPDSPASVALTDLRQAALEALVPVGGPPVLLVWYFFDRLPFAFTDDDWWFLRNLHEKHRATFLLVSRREIGRIEVPDDPGRSRLAPFFAVSRCGLLSGREAKGVLDLALPAGKKYETLRQTLLAWSGMHPYLLNGLCSWVVRELRLGGNRRLAELEPKELQADGRRELTAHCGRLVKSLRASGLLDDLLATLQSGFSETRRVAIEELIDLGYLVAGPSKRDVYLAISTLFSDYLVEQGLLTVTLRQLVDLSEAERKVLLALRDGRRKKNETIAAELHLDPETVKSHLKSIYAKLGIRGEDNHEARRRLEELARQLPTNI